MNQVDPDALEAGHGQASFILQLRPSTPPEADAEALARQIDQFVSMYLAASGADEADFALLSPLTWAISAPKAYCAEIEDIRADLADTLFGRADGEHVRLLRQDPADVQASEPGPEPATADPFAGWEPAHSSAATRAAMEGSSDTLDLDAPMLDIVDGDGFDCDVFEVDAWTPGAQPPLEGSVLETGFEPSDPEPGLSPDPADVDINDNQDLGSDAWMDDDGAREDVESFDALLETPDRSAPADVAAELAAFRAQMREIAEGIAGASGNDALDTFRSELDSITGALGQRVDGAAQRIESAADRVADSVASLPDTERMAGAVERAEASAQLMETSVKEAVSALTTALKAMNVASGQPENHADAGA